VVGYSADVVVSREVTARMPTDPARCEVEPRSDGLEAGVAAAIDAIRPALQADGGDIVLHGVDGDGVVHVGLVGACGTCPVSVMTLKAGVERIVKDRVPAVSEVVADD
jgi:Fe-S cluster biogenesis protein NfuA